MIHHLHVVAVLILITDTLNTERTFGLKPPQDVKIVGSYLQWKPSKDDNVLYSLQYTYNPKYNAEDEWLNVSSHIGRKLRITPEFYGAVFRVRTEKGNNVSEWQYSNPVQCVNVETFCIPVTNLIVTPERVSLTMAHMDESLDKEYGEHIEFNISYWKVDNGGSPKVESIITNRKNEPFPELELEQNYCFQVEYLLYNKPYGNASKERCEFIPETPEAARRRVLLYSILTTFFVSSMCGICIFVLFKYHKKVKQLLQPVQLEIPDHYREVLYGRFPLQAFPSPSSQSLRSCDLITVIEEEEQEKRSLT